MEDALRVMHTIIQFNILLRVLILVLIEDTLRVTILPFPNKIILS